MPASNLPIQLTSFIGRKHEIAEISQLLVSAHLVSLVGPGGCGKTRLALRVAAVLNAQHNLGVSWVDLARLTDPGLVPQVVAKALNVVEQLGTPLMDTLLDSLCERQTLLVLDNCEHLLTACAQLVEALAGCPNLTILATSREPLGVSGETLYPVLPLALPSADLSVDEIRQIDSVRLFVERARSILPNFSVTLDNAEIVSTICRDLDGIPLAIELASARVNVLGVKQIQERLDRRLDLLVSTTRTDERHRTLRAAIDWSYDLLSPSEQRLLQRLTLFTAGFALSTAESACAWGEIQREDVLDLLSSLVGKSLVVAETLQGSEARYRLLETIRQYAQEKLVASGVWAETHDHYLDCYVRIADEIAPKLFGQYQQTWFNWLETEHNNLPAAFAWALEQGRIEAGLRIATALYQFWIARGYVREGFTWFERLHRLIDEAEETNDAIPFAIRVNALTTASFLAMFVGDAPAATDWSQRAVALCEAAGQEGKPLLGFALAGVISAASAAGDYQSAYAIGERALELERESGDRPRFGMMLFTQGMRATMLGKCEAAHAYLDEAMVVARQDSDPFRIALVLAAMGDLARSEQHIAQASTLYEQCLAMFRELGAVREISNTERALGYACLRQGDTQRALALFRQNLEAQRAQANRTGILRGLMGFGALAAAAGLAEASARLHGFVFANGEGFMVTYDAGARADELEYAYYADTVRVQLNEAEFEAAQLEGRGLSLEQATEYALDLTFSASAQATESHLPSHGLTSREREVVILIARGKSNGEIADELVLSKRTVEKHIGSILSKLEMTGRAQIVRWAIEQGLLEDSLSQ